MDPMSKHWCGTSYKGLWTPPKEIEYAAYQREICPDTKRLHFQFYVMMKTRKRFSTMKLLLPGDHIEQARDPKAAASYAMKEATRVEGPWEVGTNPHTAKTNIPTLLRSKRPLDVMAEMPTLWRHWTVLNKIRSAVAPIRDHMTQGYLLSGQTGTGKSKIAHIIGQFLGDTHWQAPECQWWDGYDGQALTIIDEFRGDPKPAYMLRLIDRYPLQVPLKGSMANYSSKMIIMTSNLTLDQMYPLLDETTKKALRRRVKELIVY